MIRRVIIVVVVISALLTVLFWSQKRRAPLRVSGFIEAHEARVGSHISGRIKAVHAEEGQVVKVGDVLVELEPYDLPARHAAAAASVAQRQAALDLLTSGFRKEDIAQARARFAQAAATVQDLQRGARPQEVAAARAHVGEAQAALQLAQSEYKRINDLFVRKVTTQSENDHAASTLRAAEATAEARKQDLALVEAGSREDVILRARAEAAETSEAMALMENGNRAEDIAQAKAALAGAVAQLAALDKQIEELVVRASLSGRIEAVELRPGDLLQADAPVLSVLDLSDFWVRAYVPESKLSFKVGQDVEVTVDSFPGEKFKGRLTFLAQQSEFTPNNVQTVEDRSKQVLRIRVKLEKLEKLHPGMSADVWFPGETMRE